MSRTSVYDFRDSDLMARLLSLGAEGALALELADEMGINTNEAKGNVWGARLSYMRKNGMLEYDEKTHLWRVSNGGERVMESHVRAAATRKIEEIPDEAMVEVMSHVTARYRLGDPLVATMLRREFQYGTSARSRVWGR